MILHPLRALLKKTSGKGIFNAVRYTSGPIQRTLVTPSCGTGYVPCSSAVTGGVASSA
jgi:hypothetical protein